MEELLSGDPRTVGPFTLRGRLGAGGMGQVYLGQAPDGRLAAVKVVHGGLAGDRRFRDRFAREIETARKIRASWTAPVIDADLSSDRPWLATEYITGPSLEQAVAASGPLDEPALLQLAARLATALTQLHALDVVHRDIKPSNVLLADDGPRLIDFGIARALDATRMTSTGLVVGTPAFMAPEQALGEDGGTASDVFSLAAVLTFAGSGRGPFGTAANPVAMIRRIVHDSPDLSALPERLRGELESCLAKEPQERPAASALAGRLTAVSGEVPSEAWPGPAVTAMVHRTRLDLGTLVEVPASPPPVLPRWLVVGVVAILVLVSGGIAAAVVAGQRQADQADQADQAVAAPPSPATVVVPPSAPTQVPPGPLREVSVSLIPSQIPGWTASVSAGRNAAFDVPAGWTPTGPDTIVGWKHPNGETVQFRGVAEHGAVTCPGQADPEPDARAGIAGSDRSDPAAAARERARVWGEAVYEVDGVLPEVRLGATRSVTVNGERGSHATATVVTPPGACGTPNAVVHVVALPADRGETLLWVLVADEGVVADADVERMITTIRRAGHPEDCPPDSQLPGRWC